MLVNLKIILDIFRFYQVGISVGEKKNLQGSLDSASRVLGLFFPGKNCLHFKLDFSHTLIKR